EFRRVLFRSQFAVDIFRISSAHDPNIDGDLRLGGNYIHARSTLDHARINGEAALEVSKARDPLDLPRHFEDGTVAFLEIESGMSRLASHLEREFADALARGL